MSLTSGFFNSKDGDRRYSAEQFGDLFSGLIRDGIFQSEGDRFDVTPSETEDTVIVGTGRAWFNGTWTLNDAPLPLLLSPSDILLDRYDVIYLEVNKSASVRENRIQVLTGKPATNARPPELNNSEDVWRYKLAEVYRKANTTKVKESDIKIFVGSSQTPFVTGILEVLSMEMFVRAWRGEWDDWFNKASGEADAEFNEWTTIKLQEFNKWFNDLKIVLEDDVAGNLADRLLELESRFQTLAKNQVVEHSILDQDGNVIVSGTGNSIEGRIIYLIK